MKRLFFSAVFFCLALLPLVSANAQTQTNEQAYEEFQMQPNPYPLIERQFHYKGMYFQYVAKAKIWNYAVGYPVSQLIRAYIETPDYDPFAEKTINSLYECSFKAAHEKSIEEKSKAVEICQNLIDTHLANYDVVTAAIPLVRQNYRLGDEKFLKWMRSLLIKRVLASGDGSSIHKPYVIFSMGEEAMIIKHENLKVHDTEDLFNDTRFVRIYWAEDLRTGREKRVYIDITTPMLKDRAQKKLEDPDTFRNFAPPEIQN